MYPNPVIVESLNRQYRQSLMREAEIERMLQAAHREEKAGQEYYIRASGNTLARRAWRALHTLVPSL